MERMVLLVGKSVYIHENLHTAQRPKSAQTETSALEYPSRHNVLLRMVSVVLSYASAV